MHLEKLVGSRISFSGPLKEYKAISDFDPHKTVIRGYKTVITFDNCGPTAVYTDIHLFIGIIHFIRYYLKYYL